MKLKIKKILWIIDVSYRLNTNPLDTDSLTLTEIQTANNDPTKLRQILRTIKNPRIISTGNSLSPSNTNHIDFAYRDRKTVSTRAANSLETSKLGRTGRWKESIDDCGHIRLRVPARGIQTLSPRADSPEVGILAHAVGVTVDDLANWYVDCVLAVALPVVVEGQPGAWGAVFGGCGAGVGGQEGAAPVTAEHHVAALGVG